MSLQEEYHLTSISSHKICESNLITANRRFYYAAKRVLDVILASCLLITFLPVMILVSLAIYIYSPGPIFFIQERVGAKRQMNGKFIKWEQKNFTVSSSAR